MGQPCLAGLAGGREAEWGWWTVLTTVGISRGHARFPSLGQSADLTTAGLRAQAPVTVRRGLSPQGLSEATLAVTAGPDLG